MDICLNYTDIPIETEEDSSNISSNYTDLNVVFNSMYCFKITMYILLTLWTIFGNIIVLYVIAFNPTLKSTTNTYLMNLAITDILVGIFCMMINTISQFYSRRYYPYGQFMCKFTVFTRMTCLTASVLTLSAISCDRFIAIMFPLHVRITKQRTSAVITVIWMVAMIVSIPFPIYRTHLERQWSDFLEIQCSDVWPEEVVYSEELKRCIRILPAKKIYYTFVTVTLFFLPIVVMTSSYSLIVWRLWVTELPGERNLANINVQHRAKKKVIKMVCVVLVVFVLCWMPFQVIVLYSQFGHSAAVSGQLPSWFNAANYFATFVAYSNSAMNPIIYGGFNNNFRQAFLTVFKCGLPTRTFKRPRQRKTRSLGTTRSSIVCYWRFSKKNTLSTSTFP